jgi:hypothetical protein
MTNETQPLTPRGAYRQKTSSRGGARAGAGRPKGSTNKLKMEDLLRDLESALGRSYGQQIADNYVTSISRSDWASVRDYDKILLGKIIADRQEVTVDNTQDVREAKEQAFTEALASLTNVAVLTTRTKTKTGTDQ